jgi:tripartite-type tricarboxylate transporter receptor subunit TctC
MARITRRALIASAGIAAPALLTSRFANAAAGASNFPFKPIRFIIPYAPGGGFDVYVRMIAPVMEQFLPKKVAIIPLNVSGGGGARGGIQLYRARPDGYTLGIFNIPGVFILQQQQGNDSEYDLAKYTWIGAMGEGEHYVLAVGANSPLKSFDDLKKLSAERPIKFSATGPEGTAYAATVIGTKLLGLRAQLITGYRSSADYVVAAIRGDSDAVIAGYPTAMRFVRGNQIRLLATFRKEPGSPIPDADALGQPDLDQIRLERVVGAPPGLPLEIRAILSNALAKAVIDPKVVAWAKENDIVMRPKTAPTTAALVGQQRAFFDRWKQFLAATG